MWWCHIDNVVRILSLPSAAEMQLMVEPLMIITRLFRHRCPVESSCLSMDILRGNWERHLRDLWPAGLLDLPPCRFKWIHKLIQLVHSVWCHIKEEIISFSSYHIQVIFLIIFAFQCYWRLTSLKLGIMVVLHCGFFSCKVPVQKGEWQLTGVGYTVRR